MHGGVVLAACVIVAGGRQPIHATPSIDSRVTCADCHPGEAEQYSGSPHAAAGFDCRTCHGGAKVYRIQTQGLAQYTQEAPAPTSRPVFDHGEKFTGKPARSLVPQRCGQCHADVEVIDPFGLRTDQLARYNTSGHGKRLHAKKDDRVAVCIDCHGTHDVRGAKDPASPVHPLNMPETCGRCHGDAALMSNYDLSSQVVRQYKESIHGERLLKDRDLAMPTCATCHGNHGAKPPGFRDVGHVCGRCHQQTETYFKESLHAKYPGFPPCVGCHSPGADRRDHRIVSVTRSPEELADLYHARWEELTKRGTTRSEIHDILGKEMSEALEKLEVRLREVCQQCHSRRYKVGHGLFFEEVDRQALAAGPKLDGLIRQAELQYVQTSAR